DTLVDQADDQLIRYQPTTVHDFLDLQTQLGSRLDRRTQHIAGGNLRNAEPLADELGLCALAGAWGTQKDDAHVELLNLTETGAARDLSSEAGMLHRVVEAENSIPFRKTKRGFNIHAELVMHKLIAPCQPASRGAMGNRRTVVSPGQKQRRDIMSRLSYSKSLVLGLVPERVQSVQRRVGKPLAGGGEGLLDITQPPFEFLVAFAQGGFGIDLEMARQVDHGKQQIAQLLFDRVMLPPANGLAHLVQLLGDLVDHRGHLGPVEAGCGGPL